MLHILLVTTRPEIFNSFVKALSSDPEVCLDQKASGAEALSMVRTKCPHLVIVDSGLPDVESLHLVKEIISVNAMVNTAVVSLLSDQEFHDAGEGLGILCRLPPESGNKEAGELLQQLRALIGPVG